MTHFDSVGGIDCGKRSLEVAIFPGLERIRVDNTPEGVARLLAWLAERHVRTVGLEASGGVERLARDALIDAGLAVQIFDPKRVRHFAKAKGRRAKNDPIDAAVIAEFTAVCPSPPTLRDPQREELAGLLRARRLVVTKRADLAKALDLVPAAAQAPLQAAITQLTTAAAEIEALIATRLSAEAHLARVAATLMSAPGLGSLTAATLVALLPELGHTTGPKIAALVGVAPYDDDSGERRGQRRIAGGRAEVRRALYMAALSASHGTGLLAAFYRRLRQRGKPAKVALTACMRKLLVRLNAMLASGARWQEEPA